MTAEATRGRARWWNQVVRSTCSVGKSRGSVTLSIRIVIRTASTGASGIVTMAKDDIIQEDARETAEAGNLMALDRIREECLRRDQTSRRSCMARSATMSKLALRNGFGAESLARAKRCCDLLDRCRLLLGDSSLGFGDSVRDVEHERPVGVELVRCLLSRSVTAVPRAAIVPSLTSFGEATIPKPVPCVPESSRTQLTLAVPVCSEMLRDRLCLPKLSVKSRWATDTSMPEPVTPCWRASHSSSVKSAFPAISPPDPWVRCLSGNSCNCDTETR